MFPPLAPDANWWRRFLKSLAMHQDESKAIAEANRGLESPKAFGRFLLHDTQDRPQWLSVAVEGGGRQLRNSRGLENLKLSEHGDWRKVHLGAIEAALGRRPFYRDLEEDVKRVYSDPSLQTLRDFNLAIFNIAFAFLMENITFAELNRIEEEQMLRERGKEVADKINFETGIIETLAQEGPESIFGLIMGK